MSATAWNQIKKGDEGALILLYEEYYRQLFAFGLHVYGDKELVKDCIHELFCEIWDRRGKHPDVVNVKAYLFTYLKRKILKTLKVSGNTDELGTAHYEKVSTASYEELLIGLQADDELKQKLAVYLQKLTRAQLEIIQLKFYDNLKYEEIAVMLNLQPRTVYNHVFEALKTLRKYMKVLFFSSFGLILPFFQ